MLLLRGATRKTPVGKNAYTEVSIHAPLARSNSPAARLYLEASFNTCSSCEEQQISLSCLSSKSAFQYMLLLRGATKGILTFSSKYTVSIHAPLARSNPERGDAVLLPTVSIHAPLARSNRRRGKDLPPGRGFNTCSSCEEQRGASFGDTSIRTFQYMLLLRGAT